MRKVEIGNANAIEGFRDEPDGELKYRELPGERTTTLIIPDDLDVAQAAQAVITTMSAHMAPNASVAWIACSEPTLHAYLCNHYGVSVAKARPAAWGKKIDGEYREPKKRAPRRPAAVAAPAEGPDTTNEEGDA